MHKYQHLKETGKRYQSVILPGMPMNVLIAAIALQSELKTVPGGLTSIEMPTYWEDVAAPLAKREITLMTEVILIDRAMTLEVARHIFNRRNKEWRDPFYILFNELPFWEYYPETDGQGWDFLFTNIRKHVAHMTGLSYDSKGWQQTKFITRLVLEDIEDTFPNMPAYKLKNIRALVEKTLQRIVVFMSHSAKGTVDHPGMQYEYCNAILSMLGLAETEQVKVRQALMGVTEMPPRKVLLKTPGDGNDPK